MGQHAIITGASEGMGAALARELARRGYGVGLVARRGELLEAIAAEIRADGGQAATAVADVTDAAGLSRAVASLEAELGTCEVMVANAGLLREHSVTDWDPEATKVQMAVNFDGLLNTISAVLPAMVERKGGHLVAVSSVSAARGIPRWSGYAASKSAVTSFMEGLRPELREHGVHVTILHPGYVETALTAPNAEGSMPLLISATRFASEGADAIDARAPTRSIPRVTGALMLAMRVAPTWLYDRIVSGQVPPRDPDA